MSEPTTEKSTAENGGEFVKLFIHWNPNAIAVTSSGKIYVRIGDQSVPVGPEDVARLAADKGCISWEDIVTNFSWKDADEEKLSKFLELIKASDRVSDFVKQKDTKELLDYYYMTDDESDNMTQLGVLFIGKQTQRGRIMNAPVVQCIKYDQYGHTRSLTRYGKLFQSGKKVRKLVTVCSDAIFRPTQRASSGSLLGIHWYIGHIRFVVTSSLISIQTISRL